jgi:putative flippase GtrA
VLRQFVKFASVGLLATIVHVAIVYSLVEGAGAEPVLASLPAFFSALSVSYLLNRYWTFQASVSGYACFIKYTFVSLGGMFLNVAIMYVAVYIAQGTYLQGLAIVIVIVPVMSFLFQRGWTFERLGGQSK